MIIVVNATGILEAVGVTYLKDYIQSQTLGILKVSDLVYKYQTT